MLFQVLCFKMLHLIQCVTFRFFVIVCKIFQKNVSIGFQYTVYTVSKIIFLKEINTLIYQGHIKFIKSASKDSSNVTKDFYLK